MDLAALVAAVVALVAALIARHHAKRAATFHRAALSSAGRAAASALRVDEQRGGAPHGDERDDAVRCRIAAAARTDGRVAVVKPCLDRTPHASHDTGDGEPLIACPGVPELPPGAGGLVVPR